VDLDAGYHFTPQLIGNIVHCFLSVTKGKIADESNSDNYLQDEGHY
jgi:hypothetical protein